MITFKSYTFISFFTAHCAPLDENEDNSEYPQDADIDYNDDLEDSNDDDRKASTTHTPAVSQQLGNFTEEVDSGKSVRLFCKGEYNENNENHIIMWYNGSALLFSGVSTVTKDKRVHFSKKDGSLTIENTNVFDNNLYKCRFFDKKDNFDTNYQVKVKGAPKFIEVTHNRELQKLKQDQVVSYKATEKDLRFKCQVGNVYPGVKYTWNHNGNAIQESKDRDIKFDGENILEIRVLHARHAGFYECEATNEFGSIKSAFKIDVQCK